MWGSLYRVCKECVKKIQARENGYLRTRKNEGD